MSRRYHARMSHDDLPTIVRGSNDASGDVVGRALTRGDCDAIVAELNKLEDLHNDALREALLSSVTDAIENAFEGQT